MPSRLLKTLLIAAALCPSTVLADTPAAHSSQLTKVATASSDSKQENCLKSYQAEACPPTCSSTAYNKLVGGKTCHYYSQECGGGYFCN